MNPIHATSSGFSNFASKLSRPIPYQSAAADQVLLRFSGTAITAPSQRDNQGFYTLQVPGGVPPLRLQPWREPKTRFPHPKLDALIDELNTMRRRGEPAANSRMAMADVSNLPHLQVVRGDRCVDLAPCQRYGQALLCDRDLIALGLGQPLYRLSINQQMPYFSVEPFRSQGHTIIKPSHDGEPGAIITQAANQEAAVLHPIWDGMHRVELEPYRVRPNLRDAFGISNPARLANWHVGPASATLPLIKAQETLQRTVPDLELWAYHCSRPQQGLNDPAGKKQIHQRLMVFIPYPKEVIEKCQWTKTPIYQAVVHSLNADGSVGEPLPQMTVRDTNMFRLFCLMPGQVLVYDGKPLLSIPPLTEAAQEVVARRHGAMQLTDLTLQVANDNTPAVAANS